MKINFSTDKNQCEAIVKNFVLPEQELRMSSENPV